MKTTILTALLLAFGTVAHAAGNAQEHRFDPHKVNISSQPVVYIVTLSSEAMTQIDTPKAPGSFLAMVQNPSTSADICCAFTATATTTTVIGTDKCVRVEKNNGTFTVNRWWRDISFYCQTLHATLTQPAICVQGR